MWGVEVPQKNGEFIFIYKKGTSTHERLTMRSQILKKTCQNVCWFHCNHITSPSVSSFRLMGYSLLLWTTNSMS